MAQGNVTAMPSPGKKAKRDRKPFFHVANGPDMYFFVLLIIILVIGLATLYSASHVYAFYHQDGDSYFYIRKQVLWVALGLAAMLAFSVVDYHVLHKIAWLLWIVSLGLLVVAYLMPSSTGIHRWIRIPGLGQFQPSEVAKFALILLFAHLISLNHKRMKTFTRGFLPLMVILGITCGLVIIEPHLSGTLLIGLLGFVMMYVGGVSVWWLLAVVGTGVVGVVVMVLVLGYEQDRIAVWLHPLECFANQITFPDGVSGRNHAWQTVQSLYAIGSGGLLGQGPGNSRQKHLFLPEPQNDFIFSVYCEEMGFVGALIVIALFLAFIWRGYVIAMHAPDTFSALVVFGLVTKVGLQAFLNIGVVTDVLPNTGISLPFFSYGGSSLVILMLEMGVILSVSRHSYQRR